jgi:A/G-specific adenine glycosylase
VLAWYATHGRDLPWRRTRDPYAVFVSEILSQQTQIARVLPVYERVLTRYPTVEAMAQARLAEVKAITDPLGYKARGRWLHQAALQVADRWAGAFPKTLDGLRTLPGVGRYTSAAIMSFAYGADVPALDTNIARVLSRHFALGVSGRARPWRLRDAAGAVISRGRGYAINQALMDLGATVCRARAPRCPACPLWRSCQFRRAARQ